MVLTYLQQILINVIVSGTWFSTRKAVEVFHTVVTGPVLRVMEMTHGTQMRTVRWDVEQPMARVLSPAVSLRQPCFHQHKQLKVALQSSYSVIARASSASFKCTNIREFDIVNVSECKEKESLSAKPSGNRGKAIQLNA